MKEFLKTFLPNSLIKLYLSTKLRLQRKLRFAPKDERVSFNSQTVSDGHFHVTYRGIPAIRCPFDYVMYQMIISEIKPDLVIEIGTNHGGGALYLADLMDAIGHGTIHTIDIVKRTGGTVANHPRIKLFTDGWENYSLSEADGFSKILIIEDASHTYEDTLGALRKFSPLVSIDSYFIVEDGIVSELGREKGFHGGPLRAIREFLTGNSDFRVDRKYCDMFGKNATFNVNGYLKKIR
ncbi:MAG: CmcI family methyltransferase [Minisyncoccota bacterium]